MISFDELKGKYEWRPIHDCPGRFVLSYTDKFLAPEDLIGVGTRIYEFRVEKAKDTVLVAAFMENPKSANQNPKSGCGGLISYKRTDGTYLHTLNTTDGFERKLAQLGIEIEPPPF